MCVWSAFSLAGVGSMDVGRPSAVVVAIAAACVIVTVSSFFYPALVRNVCLVPARVVIMGEGKTSMQDCCGSTVLSGRRGFLYTCALAFSVPMFCSDAFAARSRLFVVVSSVAGADFAIHARRSTAHHL